MNAEKALKTLEYQKILDMLKTHVSSERARELADETRPTDDKILRSLGLLKRLRQTNPVRAVVGPEFRNRQYRDVFGAHEKTFKSHDGGTSENRPRAESVKNP